MNHNWQNWIEKLGDKDLTEGEVRAFQDAILDAPENIDSYLDELLPDTVIESDGLGKLPVHTEISPSNKVSPLRVILPVAASIAMLIAAWSFFQRPGDQVNPPAQHIATITNTNELSETSGLAIGQPLYQQTIKLEEGAEIGVAMRDGALLEIHGPAEFSLESNKQVALSKGRIATYAPEYAQGFTITTNDGKIIDLGTRFVTSTGTNLGTEVHVQEGLVEAYTIQQNAAAHNLSEQHAVALKDGGLEAIEYLEKRLYVPLDPTLVDSDDDGFADVIEQHYDTDPQDSKSAPAALRIEEGFANYQSGPIIRDKAQGLGFAGSQTINGKGNFLYEGLNYGNNQVKLKSSGGCVSSTGMTEVGISLSPNSIELPRNGVIYLSFLMQQPAKALPSRFSGLILESDNKEELFVGELSVVESYGSRLKAQKTQDSFDIAPDGNTHLFVVRIDQTRLLTDVFIDPPLNQPEQDITPQFRYYDAPIFDKIVLRSGSVSQDFPVRFDEIRAGLSWQAVLPLEESE